MKKRRILFIIVLVPTLSLFTIFYLQGVKKSSKNNSLVTNAEAGKTVDAKGSTLVKEDLDFKSNSSSQTPLLTSTPPLLVGSSPEISNNPELSHVYTAHLFQKDTLQKTFKVEQAINIELVIDYQIISNKLSDITELRFHSLEATDRVIVDEYKYDYAVVDFSSKKNPGYEIHSNTKNSELAITKDTIRLSDKSKHENTKLFRRSYAIIPNRITHGDSCKINVLANIKYYRNGELKEENNSTLNLSIVEYTAGEKFSVMLGKIYDFTLDKVYYLYTAVIGIFLSFIILRIRKKLHVES